MAEFNFENFNQLNGFVTNEIIPSCKQFDSQISELETKIKDCVTVQSMSCNTVQPSDFDELKIEVENMKIKVDEMFGSLDGADPLGTITLRNEIDSIKKALQYHGITIQ